MRALTVPLTGSGPISLSPSLPIRRATVLQLYQLTTLQWPLNCSAEGKSRMSHTLNQKLQMNKLSKEGRSKAETCRMPGFLHPTARL